MHIRRLARRVILVGRVILAGRISKLENSSPRPVVGRVLLAGRA